MFVNLYRAVSPFAVMGAIACGAVTAPFIVAQPARSQDAAKFPDVPADYWAQPFIQVLNRENIITGYPDGTYRPQQAVNRDEFAAIIRQAFNREPVRDIESGSAFKDVPQGYWAAPPIQEAYETGFMKSFPNNTFQPKSEITKLEALVSLAKGLNLTYTPAAPQASATVPVAPVRAAAIPQRQRRRAKRPLAFPLAMTTLMQPLVQPAVAAVQSQIQPEAPTPQAAAPNTPQPSSAAAREYIARYYQDADRVPAEAVDAVAAVTQAGIVVNHPEVRRLEPAGILDRGTTAALIHQALAAQNKLQPLTTGAEANKYVVKTP